MSEFHVNCPVFIRNVSYQATPEEVKQAFAREVGGCEGVLLLPSDSGSGHCGCGFAYFRNEYYRQSALNDGMISLHGRAIVVQPAQPRRKKNTSAPEKESVQSR